MAEQRQQLGSHIVNIIENEDVRQLSHEHHVRIVMLDARSMVRTERVTSSFVGLRPIDGVARSILIKWLTPPDTGYGKRLSACSSPKRALHTVVDNSRRA
jgi:hypothetical protein